MPAFSILIGQLNDVFNPAKFADLNYSLQDAITPIALYFLCIFSISELEKYFLTPLDIGIAAFVLSYLETGFWMLSGERQIRRVRENYLKAVLRQVIILLIIFTLFLHVHRKLGGLMFHSQVKSQQELPVTLLLCRKPLVKK